MQTNANGCVKGFTLLPYKVARAHINLVKYSIMYSYAKHRTVY